MDINLIRISKENFDKNDSPILFMDNISNREWALLTNGLYTLKIAWHSDLINPMITKIDGYVYGIGIDQNFAVVDFSEQIIKLNLHLFYNFFETKILGDFFFIISELEIIKIEKFTLEIVHKYDLPEIFEEVVFKSDHYEIKCFGGYTIVIN